MLKPNLPVYTDLRYINCTIYIISHLMSIISHGKTSICLQFTRIVTPSTTGQVLIKLAHNENILQIVLKVAFCQMSYYLKSLMEHKEKKKHAFGYLEIVASHNLSNEVCTDSSVYNTLSKAVQAVVHLRRVFILKNSAEKMDE